MEPASVLAHMQTSGQVLRISPWTCAGLKSRGNKCAMLDVYVSNGLKRGDGLRPWPPVHS